MSFKVGDHVRYNGQLADTIRDHGRYSKMRGLNLEVTRVDSGLSSSIQVRPITLAPGRQNPFDGWYMGNLFDVYHPAPEGLSHPGDSVGDRLTAMNLEVAARQAKDALVEAELRLAAHKAAQEVKGAEQERRLNLGGRIDRDHALATATRYLLARIRQALLQPDVLVENEVNANPKALAQFRKELQPLAKSYGVRIILTGDRTVATLVTI